MKKNSCDPVEENNSIKAVQEYDSVLVDKICEVCGNPFQAFELINSEDCKRLCLATCETCSYYIPSHTGEKNHVNAFEKVYNDKCSKSFSHCSKLERRQMIFLDSKCFCCKMCEQRFKRNDKLIEHLKAVHSNDRLEKTVENICSYCGNSGGVIRVTVGDDVADFLNLCEVCNISRLEKKTSEINKGDPKLFQCDLCPRVFSRKDHVTRHRLSHLDIKPYECYLCDKSFNRNDRLLRHMKSHPDAKPFVCKVCSEAFTEREELRLHQMIHPSLKSKARKCEVCKKEFKDRDSLEKHITTHPSYEPYCCKMCGKCFKLQDTLLSHQQLQHNWKPFQCNKCHMAFKIKDTYKRHLLVHSDQKKYSCHLCSKTFARSDKLKSHFLVHVDFKPYICDICSNAFKRKDKLMRHRREVHNLRTDLDLNSNMLICDVCKKIFDCEDDLSEHKMVHYR